MYITRYNTMYCNYVRQCFHFLFAVKTSHKHFCYLLMAQDITNLNVLACFWKNVSFSISPASLLRSSPSNLGRTESFICKHKNQYISTKPLESKNMFKTKWPNNSIYILQSADLTDVWEDLCCLEPDGIDRLFYGPGTSENHCRIWSWQKWEIWKTNEI